MEWLKQLLCSKTDNEQEKQDFPDLTPTAFAEETGVYESRLKELLINRADKVREIAVTSPYGGGKSSFLNTFKRKNHYFKFTTISLSNFSSNSRKTQIEIDQIERGILQQLLYRTSSRQAPHSRFRRIFPKPVGEIKLAALVFWFLALIALRDTPLMDPSWVWRFMSETSMTEYLFWGMLAYLLVILSLSAGVLRYAFKELARFNLSAIGIWGGHIEAEKVKAESDFNLCLEEIIYYFANTKSDVVIFEDLDRFNNTEIFEKLKALNKLINDSVDVEHSVRFIYAIRDDVFSGSARTKFFDAIIPIVPIATKDNSYPQIKKYLSQNDFSGDISDTFLRKISVYLDDIRMIKNIVSEYGIYKKVLLDNSSHINLESLFSLVVCKNFYSDKFANLHRGEGVIPLVFDEANSARLSLKSVLETEGVEIRSKVDNANAELIESIDALNSLCIVKMLTHLNQSSGILTICGHRLDTLSTPEVFDKIWDANPSVTYTVNHGTHQNKVGFNFQGLVNKVLSSYEQRKKIILDRNRDNQKKYSRRLEEIRVEIRSLERKPIRDLVNKEILDKYTGSSGSDLIWLLIRSGYIDENYHLYISRFLEGYVTKVDMKYVRSVQQQEPLGLRFKVNNIPQLLDYLYYPDYQTIAFANIDVFEFLLSTGEKLPVRAFFERTDYDTQEFFECLYGLVGGITAISTLFEIIVESPRRDMLVELVETEQLSDQFKIEFIFATLRTKAEAGVEGLIEVEGSKLLKEFIDDQGQILAQLDPGESSALSLLWNLSSFGVKFLDLPHCDFVSEHGSDIANLNIFDINTKNLSVLVGALEGGVLKNNITHDSLVSSGNDDVLYLVEKNHVEIARLLSTGSLDFDSGQSLVPVLNSLEIPQQIKSEIAQNLDFMIDDGSSIDSGSVLSELLSNRRVLPSWPFLYRVVLEGDEEKAISSDALALVASDDEFIQAALLSFEDGNSDFDPEDLADFFLKNEVSVESLALYVEKFGVVYDSVDVAEKEIKREKARKIIAMRALRVSDEDIQRFRSESYELSAQYFVSYFESYLVGNDTEVSVELEVDEFYELLGPSADTTKVQKKRIIEKFHNLIDPKRDNEDIIEMLCTPYRARYTSKGDIALITADSLSGLLAEMGKYEDKARLFVSQIIGLESSDIDVLLPLVDQELGLIVDGQSMATISQTRANHDLIEALSDKGYVSIEQSVDSRGKDPLLTLKKVH